MLSKLLLLNIFIVVTCGCSTSHLKTRDIASAFYGEMVYVKARIEDETPSIKKVKVINPTANGRPIFAQEANARFDWGYGIKQNAKHFCKFLGDFNLDSYLVAGRVGRDAVANLDDEGNTRETYVESLQDGDESLPYKVYTSITCIKESSEEDSN